MGVNDGTPVAAVILWRSDNAVLLQHRDDKPGLPYSGYWTPPGGHCEPEETLEECARREFLEETAYHCLSLKFVGRVFEDQVPESAPHWVTFFSSRFDQEQIIECREGQALEFVQRRDVNNYQMPRYIVSMWDLALSLR